MPNKRTKRWTMRDGKKIRISDMSDAHLGHTINMLRRIHESELEAIADFESGVTGDMALDSLYREINRMTDVESDHPLYDDLVYELERRGVVVRK